MKLLIAALVLAVSGSVFAADCPRGAPREMKCVMPEERMTILTAEELGELRRAQEYQSLETAKWKHRATSWKYPKVGCGASYYFTLDGTGVAPSCNITWGWTLSFFGK